MDNCTECDRLTESEDDTLCPRCKAEDAYNQRLEDQAMDRINGIDDW